MRTSPPPGKGGNGTPPAHLCWGTSRTRGWISRLVGAAKTGRPLSVPQVRLSGCAVAARSLDGVRHRLWVLAALGCPAASHGTGRSKQAPRLVAAGRRTALQAVMRSTFRIDVEACRVLNARCMGRGVGMTVSARGGVGRLDGGCRAGPAVAQLPARFGPRRRLEGRWCLLGCASGGTMSLRSLWMVPISRRRCVRHRDGWCASCAPLVGLRSLGLT